MNGMRQATESPGIRLSASRKFGRYKRENLKARRDISIIDDKAMQKAMEVWHDFTKFKPFEWMDFSPEDIQRFCILVKDFEHEEGFGRRLGGILNKMMETSNHTRFELSFEHLMKRPYLLCRSNCKDVVIHGHMNNNFGMYMIKGCIHLEGDAGYRLGAAMKGGIIIVKGNVDTDPGWNMEGGLIVINGCVANKTRSRIDAVGLFMSGGEIIVNGDVYGDVGTNMRGGEIHINGDLFDEFMLPCDIEKAAAQVIKGRIYHKGKLIVDK
jgi:hypothetical protein